MQNNQQVLKQIAASQPPTRTIVGLEIPLSQVPPGQPIKFDVPLGAKFLSLECTQPSAETRSLIIWMEVKPTMPKSPRAFCLFIPGQPIPMDKKWDYLASVPVNPGGPSGSSAHLYEIKAGLIN